MIAPRTLAETHSEINTVAKMTKRIIDTCVQANVFKDPLSWSPMPPAPTSPKILDSRI